MNELQSQLRRDDPLKNEPALDPRTVARIRERILSARAEEHTSWAGSLAVSVGALVLLMSFSGAWFVNRTDPASFSASAEPRVRQLQFSAPGGTRIFWTFNPHLEVK